MILLYSIQFSLSLQDSNVTLIFQPVCLLMYRLGAGKQNPHVSVHAARTCMIGKFLHQFIPSQKVYK